jgi:glutamate dehydrogenase
MPQSKIVHTARASLTRKDPSGLAEFLDAFCERIPPDDLAQLDPGTLADTARRHWALSQKRQPGEPALAISTLKTGGTGADSFRTAIDIVNDDMPFLVASTAAELTVHGRLIELLLHPILQGGDGKTAQSHMHIELQGSLPPAEAAKLERKLQQMLHDVRLATRDWQTMKGRLHDAQSDLSHAPAAREEVDEYLAFLDYLYSDNFTLLGFRAYKIDAKTGKQSVVKNSGLGLLSADMETDYIGEGDRALTPEMEKLRRSLPPLVVSKLNRRSTVHRAVPLDAVTVKQYDKNGQLTGETLFIGLFTSVTYSRSIQDIPYLRRKADHVTERSGFRPGSHDYKALRHILEKYPRDELFQMPEEALLETAVSILQLQERHRIALYTRPDPLGQYISCLVYVPRDRYDTRLRTVMQQILESELKGHCGNFYTTLDDSPLARVMYLVYTPGAELPAFDRENLERKLQGAGRVWSEKLHDALREAHEDEGVIAHLAERYGHAFPPAYTERYEPKQAIYDLDKIEAVLAGEGFALDLYQDKSCGAGQVRLKIYNRGTPIILSDILPRLEHMGLKVISELPYEVTLAGQDSVWIHDFLMTVEEGRAAPDFTKVKATFEAGLKGVWSGLAEDDSLNELVLHAGMGWQDVQILRAYVRYLRQAQYPFGRAYIERALTQNVAIAQQIVALFHARLSPAIKKRDKDMQAATDAITALLEKVVSLDVDRILRTVMLLVQSTLRTNFYQTSEDGSHKPYLSLKLESRALGNLLPDPKPFREIFVYSPRMEGIHLRMDWIARGGIRWSDRHEDFRTEVLGLMKAQQVKNAVIVPMGAKGGFIVKNPPKTGGRDAFQKEGIECYKILIRGLLDITDNRKGSTVVPPKNVVRHDADDPYLVVAADKGTATFSDIANALSLEYGHWLGDAFASGGSAGYDHKKMGITARGAWESVKRHFREMDRDTQTEAFDCVGVGDMAGDVFGNGMLQSEQIRLIGAFNHVHIVCDPTPDPASSFQERQRLFNEVKGWEHYNTKLLSKGGRIYNRSEKSLTLTPEIKARFDLTQDNIAPADLIQAILRARADLLFFGGIGTYLKETGETNADVSDKSNDALRINASEVRSKVIGEGANLAITQRARIELALNGVRLNTDFIDNSAGVDTSDHEVNIKILTTAIMENGFMNTAKRNILLQSMTEEVAALVLRHNYQQAQGLSLAELTAAQNLPVHAAFIRDLERHSGLKRKLEGLPTDDIIQQRRLANKGMTRPELSVLLSYAKILFTSDLLATDIPDNPDIQTWLFHYFPTPLRKKYAKEIAQHRLRREILATVLSNDMVNRMGPTFVKSVMDKTASSCADVAKAWLIVRDGFGLAALWAEIEALDAKVPGAVQLRAMNEIARMVEREVTWFLTRLGREPDIGREMKDYGAGIAILQDSLEQVATPDLVEAIQQRLDQGLKDGLPPDLARRIAIIPALGAACDILRIARDSGADIPVTARTYFETGDHFRLPWLRQQARAIPANDRWTAEALSGLIEQLHNVQYSLAARVLQDAGRTARKAGAGAQEGIVAAWLEKNGQHARQLEPMIAELHQAGTLDMPMLMLAEQRLRQVAGS